MKQYDSDDDDDDDVINIDDDGDLWFVIQFCKSPNFMQLDIFSYFARMFVLCLSMIELYLWTVTMIRTVMRLFESLTVLVMTISGDIYPWFSAYVYINDFGNSDDN